jgi:hypothetical protein
MSFKHALVLVLAITATACSTVTIHPKSNATITSQPNYEESKSFYLAGLVGERRVNVTEICGEKEVAQMQTQQTFTNGFLGLITLAIYTPHTVKVWCK